MKNRKYNEKKMFDTLNGQLYKDEKVRKELTADELRNLGILDEKDLISKQGNLFKDEITPDSVAVELKRWHGFDKQKLIEQKRVQGSVFYDLFYAEMFLKDHILAYKRNYAGGAYYHYCYPMELIKSCLYFCFVRKDTLKSDPICIDIFQDRLEISFSCIQKEETNQVISHVFKACKIEMGNQEFFNKLESSYKKEKKRWKIEEKEGKMKIMLENTYYRPINQMMLKKLRPSAKRCYQMILENPGIQLNELSERLGRPYITVQTEVRTLRRKQLVERRGDLISGGYFCIEIRQNQE